MRKMFGKCLTSISSVDNYSKKSTTHSEDQIVSLSSDKNEAEVPKESSKDIHTLKIYKKSKFSQISELETDEMRLTKKITINDAPATEDGLLLSPKPLEFIDSGNELETLGIEVRETDHFEGQNDDLKGSALVARKTLEKKLFSEDILRHDLRSPKKSNPSKFLYE